MKVWLDYANTIHTHTKEIGHGGQKENFKIGPQAGGKIITATKEKYWIAQYVAPQTDSENP